MRLEEPAAIMRSSEHRSIDPRDDIADAVEIPILFELVGILSLVLRDMKEPLILVNYPFRDQSFDHTLSYD